MQKIGFDDAIDKIIQRDPRFHRDAYMFLREALDHTVKALGRETFAEPERHVRGPELLGGFRDLAIERFGPMAPTVLEDWGISQTRDVGEMVFALIEEGSFAQSNDDVLADFENVFDFYDAFVAPYLPSGQGQGSRSTQPLRESQDYHHGEANH